ncbi:MAG: hypothetical protein IJY28_10700 [Clostridia bacterium]|nr:hypothetical protein [Clostridia bacterium]
MNKSKILHFLYDFLQFTVLFMLSEWVAVKVFHTEAFLPELLSFMVLYGITEFAKSWIVKLWKRRNSK